jgi:hypothetical protein
VSGVSGSQIGTTRRVTGIQGEAPAHLAIRLAGARRHHHGRMACRNSLGRCDLRTLTLGFLDQTLHFQGLHVSRDLAAQLSVTHMALGGPRTVPLTIALPSGFSTHSTWLLSQRRDPHNPLTAARTRMPAGNEGRRRQAPPIPIAQKIIPQRATLISIAASIARAPVSSGHRIG